MVKKYSGVIPAKLGSTKDGEDHSGARDKVVGYTISESPKKNDSGHYTLDSPQEIDTAETKCYAKKTTIEQTDGSVKYKYHIKSNLDGGLFDPWGMFSEGTQGEYAKRHGKAQWSFKQVHERCFSFYVNFLQSRNKAWLTNAEREIK